MGSTPNYGITFPEQTTNPPDVAGWLRTGLTQTDAAIKGVSNSIAAKRTDLDYSGLSLSSAAPSIISDGVWKKLVFTSELGNQPTWGDPATGDITVPATGSYQLQFTGAMSPSTGLLQAAIYLNGTTLIVGQEHSRATSWPDNWLIALTMTWTLSANTKVSVQVMQRGKATNNAWGTLYVSRSKLI